MGVGGDGYIVGEATAARPANFPALAHFGNSCRQQLVEWTWTVIGSK